VEIIKLRIANWKKYNPKNQGNLSYILLNVDVFEQLEEQFGTRRLGAGERALWIVLLLSAARRNQHGTVMSRTDYLSEKSGLSEEEVESAVRLLEAFGFVEAVEDPTETSSKTSAASGRTSSNVLENVREDVETSAKDEKRTSERPRKRPNQRPLAIEGGREGISKSNFPSERKSDDEDDRTLASSSAGAEVSPLGMIDETDRELFALESSSEPKLHPLAEIWNEHCGPMPKVNSCGQKRTRSANSRWKEKPNAGYWSEVIDRMKKNKFFLGENDRGWVGNFDFLLKPEKHEKIMEGGYGSNSPSKPFQGRHVGQEQRHAVPAADVEIRPSPVIQNDPAEVEALLSKLKSEMAGGNRV